LHFYFFSLYPFPDLGMFWAFCSKTLSDMLNHLFSYCLSPQPITQPWVSCCVCYLIVRQLCPIHQRHLVHVLVPQLVVILPSRTIPIVVLTTATLNCLVWIPFLLTGVN